MPAFILLLCTFGKINAQDSTLSLSPAEVLKLVRELHPVARQAAINVQKSQADILISRGAFDPFASVATGAKTFDGTDYYNYMSPKINIPTWYGIEVYSGLESLTGKRLDPTETVGQTNYIGISVPLLKDLIIDKRRGFLQQAKIFKNMAIADQRTVVNNLLMDAMDAYWQWVKAYVVYGVVKQLVLVNEKRFNFVKRTFANGERAAIDTIEALAQLQAFQFEQNNDRLILQNATLKLSTYLWTQNGKPYDLPLRVQPYSRWEEEGDGYFSSSSLQDLETKAIQSHPELQAYQLKIDVLGIDKKLKFQEMLPKLDFTYNMLGKGYDVLKTTTKAPLFENNYLYGFKFEMPLRLSKGRGEYKKSQLKIEETKLAQSQKALEILVKIRSYFNELQTLQNQIALQINNLSNYQLLVKAEEVKLQNGESSLFLINSRENKALEAFEKLIELKTKFIKTKFALLWSAGFP